MQDLAIDITKFKKVLDSIKSNPCLKCMCTYEVILKSYDT